MTRLRKLLRPLWPRPAARVGLSPEQAAVNAQWAQEAFEQGKLEGWSLGFKAGRAVSKWGRERSA